MPTSSSEIIGLVIVISTLLALVLGGLIVRYIFLYQRRRYTHQLEVTALREDFGKTLLQSQLEIRDQILTHIAKELHSNCSYLVSLININLSELLLKCPEAMRENILETKSFTRQLTEDLKHLSV